VRNEREDRFRSLPAPVRPEDMIETVDVSPLPVRDEDGEERERLLRQAGAAGL
jgi:hypothetical protein